MTEQLAQLLQRLESVTQKLEGFASTGTVTASTVPAAGGQSSPSGVPSVVAYEDLINGSHLTSFLACSQKIGGIVAEQASIVKKLADAQLNFLKLASTSKKPADPTAVLKPMSDLMVQIGEIRENNRSSALFNHLSTVSEGIPAFGWVAVEPKPAPYVGDMKDAAQFYANRILKEFKDKDQTHVDWVAGFSGFLADLQIYVKTHHTTGVVWNAKGGDVSSANVPHRVPEPPKVPKPADAPPRSVAHTAALFGELNKGAAITSGLKKVEKSQMTHKNPELRASGVVKSTSSEFTGAKETPAFQATSASKPAPKFALEGNKWVIENHDNNKGIVVDQADLKNTVYIYNCTNCTVQIKNKVNAVVVDSCKKTGVLIESVVSSVDLINCKSVQAQITGKAPTVTIEKTDGCLLYLSRECLDIEIFTSKSSEMNVSMPGKTDQDDFIEKAIVEQFKTQIKDGALVTLPVEHKG